MECVEQARIDQDLSFVAAPRPDGSPHLEAVREHCSSRLDALGFAIEHQRFSGGVNVIGTLAGTESPETQVLVSAHYDHWSDCPGADDNASGVAGALEVARVLSVRRYPHTLIVAFWDEEEIGRRGSSAYAGRAAANGEGIAANLVFEMIGAMSTEPASQSLPEGFALLFPDQSAAVEASGMRADFIALVHDSPGSDIAAATYAGLASAIGLKAHALPLSDDLKGSQLVADLRRSDHASFWQHDLPGIMITDTADFRYPQYHCRGGDDVRENLDLAFATKVVQAATGTAARALGAP